MKRLAFIFPGQGAQKIGMGRDFYERYDIAKKLFKEADERLGYSIMKMCFEGSEEDLRLTQNTQPAILTVSVIAGKILEEHGVFPEITAGHSLGEYSALVLAGVLSFSDAVYLVHKRGKYMQEAVPDGEGAMAAVMGMDREKIIEICKETSKTSLVEAVNFNTKEQVVIAGKAEGVKLAIDALKEHGAKKAVLLPVSAPFHSTLMESAALKLKVELDKVELRDAKIPVVANVSSTILETKEEIKKSLILQAKSPVKWEDCVMTMFKFGADTFIEAGIGRTLSNFNKRIDKSIVSHNVEDENTLQKTLTALKEE